MTFPLTINTLYLCGLVAATTLCLVHIIDRAAKRKKDNQ